MKKLQNLQQPNIHEHAMAPYHWGQRCVICGYTVYESMEDEVLSNWQQYWYDKAENQRGTL
jgi:hypothetical protein